MLLFSIHFNYKKISTIIFFIIFIAFTSDAYGKKHSTNNVNPRKWQAVLNKVIPKKLCRKNGPINVCYSKSVDRCKELIRVNLDKCSPALSSFPHKRKFTTNKARKIASDMGRCVDRVLIKKLKIFGPRKQGVISCDFL